MYVDRFLCKVKENTDTGCWEWCGGLNSGYGTYTHEGKTYKAHRVSYAMFNSKFDLLKEPKRVVAHKCDNTMCVNPKHLFETDTYGNVQDMIQKGRHHWKDITHCKAGHEFTEENTIIKESRGYVYKTCKICINARAKEAWRNKNNFYDKDRVVPIHYQNRKTHCPEGHLYSEENTRIFIRSNGKTGRLCKKCEKLRTERRRVERQEKTQRKGTVGDINESR
jgi:hypothetical protein